ncbi:hypothetical protein GPECTOR_29g136 [Gonium pectorale]|uniref:Integrase catalytic domain-containing protein n=1 Tax=Gonium pectorale TaxID=33097 RepID=A0A150GEH3_GONPE|nr:hypothetical protein GPECTOR_29g136 [Gonium pectorale]|eukprot:KXZ48232.1 hypothetical protein GPECTOR_29g136 [Gonium pectorale]
MFYRWGIDLAGELPATEPHGFNYVMVCVEHFTKYAEFIPLRSKTAAETARGLLELISRFGAPAEVVTDRGTEFEAEFQLLLERCYVDHRLTSPNHPQADGAAERLVQEVKSALRKHCQETGCNNKWDQYLPWLALAYRCSPQASTRMAPFVLLYGAPPVVPPAARERLEGELAFSGNPGESEYAEALAARAAFLRHSVPVAAGNLLNAQHRDSLRYAHVRSGSYRPQELRLAPGDYVYLRRLDPTNTLQLPVRDPILRVESIGPMGVAVLLGRDTARVRRRVEELVPCHLPDIDPIEDPWLFRPRADLPCEVCASPRGESTMLLCDGCNTGWHLGCLTPPLAEVPAGSWVCPPCTALGRAAPEGPAPQRPEPAPVLFPNAATRRLDDEAAALDGRRVARVVRTGKGKSQREQEVRGTLRYKGALRRPEYFQVEWDNGSSESMRLAVAKRILVPLESAARLKRTGKK